jgi:hypothetical protein
VCDTPIRRNGGRRAGAGGLAPSASAQLRGRRRRGPRPVCRRSARSARWRPYDASVDPTEARKATVRRFGRSDRSIGEPPFARRVVGSTRATWGRPYSGEGGGTSAETTREMVFASIETKDLTLPKRQSAIKRIRGRLWPMRRIPSDFYEERPERPRGRERDQARQPIRGSSCRTSRLACVSQPTTYVLSDGGERNRRSRPLRPVIASLGEQCLRRQAGDADPGNGTVHQSCGAAHRRGGRGRTHDGTTAPDRGRWSALPGRSRPGPRRRLPVVERLPRRVRRRPGYARLGPPTNPEPEGFARVHFAKSIIVNRNGVCMPGGSRDGGTTRKPPA